MNNFSQGIPPNKNKAYVTVTARWSDEGVITPLSVAWEDGRSYEIDQVLDACRAASLKAGGCGIRYTIRIGTKSTYLFLEENRWFVERR